MNHKWASRQTDKNQKDIVSALRQIPGVSVETGKDDILVGYRGFTLWFEIKNPSAASKKGVVYESSKKESQKRLEKEWTGQYKIVTTLEEILDEMHFYEMNFEEL